MQILPGVSEPVLRLGVFVGVLLVLVALERLIPRRRLVMAIRSRWTTNLTMVALGMMVGRGLGLIAAPLAAVGAAVLAERNGIGLLHWLAVPPMVAVPIAIVTLDFAIWLQHLVSHKVPLLWRVHRMHHADRDIDVTTALRFHPIEIGLSMLYKVVWVLALGATPLAVVLFEVMLNATAMFNHANINLPRSLDRIVRLLLVTPDMHRVHHSTLQREHDTNFGFSLSIWDRMFATYTPQPQHGHDGMTIGLAPYQSDSPNRLTWCLRLPFRGMQ